MGMDGSTIRGKNYWSEVGFQDKLNENGEVDKYKARLIAKGIVNNMEWIFLKCSH